jgi:hypothetical protein
MSFCSQDNFKFTGGQWLNVLSVQEIENLENEGRVVYAGDGGLILAPFHDEGGIEVAIKWSQNEYAIDRELEGWEFLVTKILSAEELETLNSINDEFDGEASGFIEYQLLENIPILNCEPSKLGKKKLLIVPESFFVVNKHSTKKYLELLTKLFV